MSWPVGYGIPNVTMRGDLAGTIFANDVQIGERGGWVDLPAPDWCNGSDGEMTVRFRITVDAYGRPFVYAEQCELRGRRYPGVHSLALAEGNQWPDHVVVAFFAVVIRRLAESKRGGLRLAVVSRVREAEKFATPDATPLAGVAALRGEHDIALASS